ncbi:RluA family pseudouridine synthase [Clostridium rectalis]|uniref:RluA family pseudouridine synthase n=1 Tax=Clostridium rectalis TaxID=2040295 RepID=UPI000F644C23|nr:RluA family pseudouridine synthase [Clostridium rectalis]
MSNSLKFNYVDIETKKIREYLRNNLKLSGRLIKSSARDGRIMVNGKRVNLRYMLKVNDVIEIAITKDESQNIEPEKMNIKVVYEDEDLIVVNKEPYMVVHPTKSHQSGTLSNGLLYYFREKGEKCIVRLVSRLDRDTSGLIIIAKNQFSHMALARDMQKDNFKKEYIAIVHGVIEKDEETIDEPIYRSEEGSMKRVVDSRGQKSVTHYKVLKRFKNSSLVHLKLETGRTHQIRVHLNYLKHPLFGDVLYGENYEDSNYIKRQALHAYKLTFPHPRTGQLLKLHCELPEDMERLLNILKNKS